MCEQFNIEFVTTAGESLWSNATCERQNGVIKEIFKIIEGTGCSQQTALYWALSTRNSLSNNNGCSIDIWLEI